MDIELSAITYLGAKDKAELATLATNTGLMTLNEVRELYGMSPIEGGDRRLQSLNYINALEADNYQANMSSKNSGSGDNDSN